MLAFATCHRSQLMNLGEKKENKIPVSHVSITPTIQRRAPLLEHRQVHTTQWQVNEHTKFLLTLVLWDLNSKQCVHCVPCLCEAFSAAALGWHRMLSDCTDNPELSWGCATATPCPFQLSRHITATQLPSALKVILRISIQILGREMCSVIVIYGNVFTNWMLNILLT